MSRKFSIILAVDSKLGIAKNNKLPWRLPNEMKHFSQTTSRVSKEGCQNAVIMGRKSWDAIPLKYRPLPNRLNIVLSRTLTEAPPNSLLFGDLDSALAYLSEPAVAAEIEKVFVIGGAVLASEAIVSKQCERVYLTRINESFDCDIFFPADAMWLPQYTKSSDPNVNDSPQEEKGITYQIHVYDRKES